MGLPIATVNIALRTATVSRAGFGTPIFISAHNSFMERVRTYTSLTAVGEDFSSTHAAYIAAQGVFSSSPSVAQFKIGRRATTAHSLIPTEVALGTSHGFTITVDGGDSVEASYVASGGETAFDVATALVGAITGDAEVSAKVAAVVVGVAEAAVVQLTKVAPTDEYSVSGITGISESFTTSEDAATVLTAIQEVDNDFYFVTADDHTDAFVMAMAAAIQAQEKLYFVSVQELGSINDAYSPSVTDIAAKIKQNNYDRTAVMWDEAANGKYVEANYVGVNAPYSPDQRAVVWDGRELSGVDVAKNSSGNQINTTQQLNLDSRNVSYVITTNAGPRILGGKVGSGEWIDNMRTLDCMTARVREGQEALILNQKGGKLEGGQVGIQIANSRLQQSLTPFIGSKAISSFSTNTDNAVIDPATRSLSGLEFTAILSGAILRVVITGNLENEA